MLAFQFWARIASSTSTSVSPTIFYLGRWRRSTKGETLLRTFEHFPYCIVKLSPLCLIKKKKKQKSSTSFSISVFRGLFSFALTILLSLSKKLFFKNMFAANVALLFWCYIVVDIVAKNINVVLINPFRWSPKPAEHQTSHLKLN